MARHDEYRFATTEFLKACWSASTERLRAMNTEQTARHYGLPEEWVREWRDRELGAR